MKEKSIAVLPFVNLSADPDNEYFSDGMSEEIINALTTIKGLHVTARTSSFAFKNRNEDVRSIGAKLGVAAVLEGSVRKDKSRVRITAQLIDTAGGFHLWSKNFDRELKDIFALQDEISLLIADQVRENFGHLELKDQLLPYPAITISAYELYLKGRNLLHTFNRVHISQGIAILEEVISLEPNFAQAYASIHYGYNLLAAAGFMPSAVALEKGMKYLNQALELNPNLPECYHSLGWHSLNHRWDFVQARELLNKALALSPGYADAHQKLFITLALEGKSQAAYEHISMALRLDPLSPLNHYFLGYYFYLQRQYEQANQAFSKCFELGPHFLFPYSVWGLSLVAQGRADHLLQETALVPDIEGGAFEVLIMKTLANCSLKRVADATVGMAELQNALAGEEGERVRFYLIQMYALLEMDEKALDLIEEGVRRREPLMTLLREDPLLISLHQYERFQNTMRQVYALSDNTLPQEKENLSASLQEEEVEAFRQQLEQLLANEKLYLNPSLSLRLLAGHLQMHANKLSWLINEHLGKNFNEYINGYRLEAFKSKALDPAKKQITLLGLAYESGFNSKTVFNTFFKKSEGVSPRTWLKAATTATAQK